MKWPAHARLMRLHQPVGIALLLWPCLWGIGLASGGAPSIQWVLLFALGAVVMRSAGCIVNDLADRGFDKKVERTRTRPLASGEVRVQSALALLAALMLGAFAIALLLPFKALLLAFAALPLVAIYPFMKRITWWPQLFLGVTFNWGALMGWVAVRGELNAPAVALYAAGIFWTLGYDTIYAHQDKKDDAAIGVKSTALKLGVHTKRWLVVFYAASVFFLSLAGVLAGAGWIFCTGVAAMALHFIWQVRSVNLDDPTRCLRVFKSNTLAGALVAGAALI